AYKRGAGELGARSGLSCRFDEVARGLVERGRDDDVRGRIDDVRDGGTQVRLIALQSSDRRPFQSAPGDSEFHGGEIFFTDRVVIVDDREFLHSSRRIKIDDLLELVGIACANVVHVAAKRAHRLGAGKRPDECDPALFDEWKRGGAPGGVGIGDQREHASLFYQDPCVLAGAFGVVGVVQRDELEGAPVDSARIVDFFEQGLQSFADLVAKLLVAAGKRRRLADQDARLGYALGVGCAAGEQAGQGPYRSECADRRHNSSSSFTESRPLKYRPFCLLVLEVTRGGWPNTGPESAARNAMKIT